MLTLSRLNHTLHFLAAHTIASVLSLGIFLIPMLAPYLPYATGINWQTVFPYFKPFALGLGASIWILAIIPALAVHKLIRLAGLHNRQDFTLIGLATGLALSLPVLKLMGLSVVNTTVTPYVTPGWLLANQTVYAMAWAASGAVFGLCYYYLHSETYSH